MSQFNQQLIAWHQQHGRSELPWQQQRSPYGVWLSEIMLQQTQVVTVIPYFERFCTQFPDISALAVAPLDAVLALWSGLGYYSRARNLHRAAGIVAAEFGGELPADFETLLRLPGIGRSTAGAIMAQAFGQPYPILDGNVRRVLCRYHGVEGWPGGAATQKQLWTLAQGHTPEEEGAVVVDYTQAIMDLGALLCTPRNWDCLRCPVSASCHARQRDCVADLPTRKQPKKLPQRETTVVVMVNGDGALLLERRPPSGIWGGLWSLPEWSPAEGDGADEGLVLQQWISSQFGLKGENLQQLEAIDHLFTHFRLKIKPVMVRVTALPGDRVMEKSTLLWYKADQFSLIGLPTPIKRVLGVVHSKVSEES